MHLKIFLIKKWFIQRHFAENLFGVCMKKLPLLQDVNVNVPAVLACCSKISLTEELHK